MKKTDLKKYLWSQKVCPFCHIKHHSKDVFCYFYVIYVG